MTSYKFALKDKPAHDDMVEMSVAQVLEMLETAEEKGTFPVLYEVLYGAVVPYYDFDCWHEDRTRQVANTLADFTRCEDAVRKVFPTARLLWRCSHGCVKAKMATGKPWKNSFHCVVRGAGFYKQGADVPRVDGAGGADDSVYKREGKRQLFRFLGGSKEGQQRPLMRLHDGKPWPALDWNSYLGCGGTEKFEDNLIQNVEGEQYIEVKAATETKVAVGLGDAEELAMTRKEYSYVNMEFVTAVVGMLKPERADGYDTWSKTLWAIKGAAVEYKLELRPLAHEFSKRTKRDNYNEVMCDQFYDKANDEGLGLGSLRKWANEDAPAEYDALHRAAIETSRPEATVGYYEDVKTLVTDPNAPIDKIEDWMRSCMYKILNGGESFYMVRRINGEYKIVSEPFMGGEAYKTHVEKTDKKGKAKKEAVTYRSILMDLQQKPCFTANFFNEVEFMPMMGAPKHVGGKFNLFTGFKVQPTEYKDGDADVQLVLDHIRVVMSDGNETYYQYLLNWLAHMFQHPNRKIGTMPVLIGGQGAGKNILLAWLGEHVFGNMYCQLTSIESLTAKFNAYQIGKLFIVLNEIKSFSYADAGKLKSIITDVDRMAEPKGKDAYPVKCFENYMLLSNDDWTVRVEADDRRFACIRVSKKYADDTAYFRKLSTVLTSETASKFMAYLLRRDITEWNPRAIPTTELRDEMKEAGLPVPMRFMVSIAKNEVYVDDEDKPLTEVREKRDNFYAHFTKWAVDHGERYTGNDRQFWGELKKIGVEVKNARHEGVQARGVLFKVEELRVVLRTYLKSPEYKFE